MIADPTRAVICAWEALARKGAQVVNEPGAWAMSALRTHDPDAAAAFYGELLGWETEPFGELTMFRLAGFVGGEPEQPVPRDVVAMKSENDEGRAAVLDGADLRGANFRGLRADHVSFISADLRGADFTGAGIIQADFSLTCLDKARFVGANAYYAEFIDSVGDKVDFSKAFLSEAEFHGSKLTHAELTGAREADLPSTEERRRDDASTKGVSGLVPALRNLATGRPAPLADREELSSKAERRADVVASLSPGSVVLSWLGGGTNDSLVRPQRHHRALPPPARLSR